MTPPNYSEERRLLIAKLEARARATYRDVGEFAPEGDDREEGDIGGAVEYWRTLTLAELRAELDLGK